MKVLFISRTSIFSFKGGDTTQMVNTAKHLKEFNVEVDIYDNSNEIDYKIYDLIHFFNITRPAEILFHIDKCNLPYVVSSIFVDYSFYEKMNLYSLRGLLTKFFGSDGIEYFKILAKHLLGIEKVKYLPYFFNGQRKSIIKILENAKCILPNSENEFKRLKAKYHTKTVFEVIPNAVETNEFVSLKNIARKNKQLLCVAMIEPRKNQYNLIKAIKGTDYSLTIIGDSSPNHQKYFDECKQLAGENVKFLSRVSTKKLIPYYREAEIHILPSWFETTGLVSLEAAYMGCKIVVSPNGDTRDYFDTYSSFCNPESPKSILKAIENEHNNEYNDGLKKRIDKEYNWKITAEKTFKVYQKVLNQNR